MTSKGKGIKHREVSKRSNGTEARPPHSPAVGADSSPWHCRFREGRVQGPDSLSAAVAPR